MKVFQVFWLKCFNPEVQIKYIFTCVEMCILWRKASENSIWAFVVRFIFFFFPQHL